MIVSSLPWNFSRYSRPSSRTVDILLVDIIPTCLMLLLMAFSMSLVTDLTSSMRSAVPSQGEQLAQSANR